MPKPTEIIKKIPKVQRNIEKCGLELDFGGKPDNPSIRWMKEHKMRWHPVKNIWYGLYTDELLAEVKEYYGLK